MDEQKSAFYEIAQDYFKSMDLMPTRDYWDKVANGLYHAVCSMKVFTKVDDGSSYYLISPIADWRKFSTNTQRVFENKISFKRLNLFVNQTLSSLDEFPFSDAQISQYIDSLYVWVNQQYHSAYIAFVPVFNLSLGDGIEEIPLANSILHKGSENSLLALSSKNQKFKEWIKFNPDTDFLAIPVSGDSEAIAQITKLEANNSLACLRFISNWTQRVEKLNYVVKNDASSVTLFPTESIQVLYHDPQIGTEQTGMTNYISKSIYYVSKDTYEYLKDVYELDNINYHFQSELNPVSNGIIRALELYDSGVIAELSWQSLYRYVASINTVVHPGYSKEKEIVPRLQTLIRFGGNYVGTMEKVDSPEWSVLVEKTVHLYFKFHRLRGAILHGAILHPDLEQVNKVRILANNCIRLMAVGVQHL